MKSPFLYTFSLIIVTFLTISLTMTSCSSEDDANAKRPSISSLVLSQANLSTLGIALERTNLLSTLDNEGTYTLFAPTNDAFSSFLAANGFSNINEVPSQTLKQILLNHVISQVKTTTDLPSNGYLKTLAVGNESTNTLSMYVSKTNNTILINNFSKIISADFRANNGIIQIVNTVIGLPSISSHIIANPNLTSFLGIITNPNQPDFITTFYGTGPFTVFAPTNTAISSLNTELSGGIASVSASNMTKIINYHIASGNILSSNFTEGQIINTLNTPQYFTILLSPTTKLKDTNNRYSTISTTDIQCTNGVIHLINKTLLPTL